MSQPKHLDDFIAWLVQKGKSPGTAKVYASSVRIILKETEERCLEQSFLDNFFGRLSAEKPNLYPARLTSYNAWADFHREHLSLIIPRPSTKKGTEKADPLPDDICGAIRKLRGCAISFRHLSLMTWEDVEFLSGARGDFYHVRDPTKKGVSFKASADAIDTIMAWADPQNEFLPLIPLFPGSDQHYPVKGLQREAAKGQESLRERVARLRREERNGDHGSALGAAKEKRGVTPQTYHSDYLPKVKATDTVEGLLGLGKPAVSRREREAQSPLKSNGSPRPEGAGIAGVSAKERTDLLRERKANQPAASDPPRSWEEACFRLGLSVEAAEKLKKQFNIEAKEEPQRIEPLPPEVGPDGLLYDPNDL